MSERQSVEIDLNKLRARMLRGPITEEQIDLLFALIETSRDQAAKAEADAAAWLAFVGEAAWQLEHGAKCAEIQSDLVEAYQGAKEGNAPGAQLLIDLEAAYHALMSYACGNSAPALAEEMAAIIGKWIGKGKSE